MREIKFRGKRVDNGELAYGYVCCTDKFGCLTDINNAVEVLIINNDYDEWEVIKETVGQFTGLKDKNGKEIYEGDIVREHANDYTPIYQNGIYMAYNVDKINDPYVSTQFNVIWRNGCSIIGNIHDNKELLK